MTKRIILFVLTAIFLSNLPVYSQSSADEDTSIIQIGSFNIEWFPCKEDGEMMKKYGINLRIPPQGQATDIPALFNLLKELDIELLGLVEVVDTQLLQEKAIEYLGPQYKFIYAPSPGSQKVGFLYDSSVLELVGKPQVYMDVALKPDSWLRPAFRAYFKALKTGFDFHAVVVHLKAGPAGWDQRQKQWAVLERILEQVQNDTGDKDVVLMGDFNNVSKLGYDEFKPLMEKMGFYWATSEIADSGYTNYWQPDYREERIQGSLIDQIFISRGALEEYVKNSVEVGGMCRDGKPEYKGEAIPEYREKISDHCPVYCSFLADKDND